MTISNRLILAFWLVFIAYWALSAVRAKRSVGARIWWRESGLRLSIVVLILLVLHVPALSHAIRNAQAHAAGGMLTGLIGVAVCGLGLGLAVWARVHLGRNWGMPMSRKEDPELVTSGPYASVRHPIYTGMLLAMLGSTIGESVFWALPLILFGVYFIYSAEREEKLLIEQFPQQYPAYITRTKMLLPFVV
jgi:protein-S-isoprenylcysteine O-methyltransferase Ste14